MADPAPIDSLLDILELIERIERQTGGLTREAFLQQIVKNWLHGVVRASRRAPWALLSMR